MFIQNIDSSIENIKNIYTSEASHDQSHALPIRCTRSVQSIPLEHLDFVSTDTALT